MLETRDRVDVPGAHSKLTIAVDVNTATDTFLNTFDFKFRKLSTGGTVRYRLTLCNQE